MRKEATRKAFNLVLIFIALFVVFISLYFFMIYNSKFNSLSSSVDVVRDVVDGNGVVDSLENNLSGFYFVFISQALVFIISALSLVFSLWYVGRLYFIEYRNALIDPLTDLYNKGATGMALDKEIMRSKRYKHPLSIAILDIDFFKKYNDRLGHVAGDKLLIRFAKLMKNNVREIDYVGRIGGEEFLIIFPETKLKDATKVMEKIRKIVEESRFHGADRMPHGKVTVSVGVKEFKSGFKNKENFVHEADENLYRAKRSGRNRVISE